MNSHRQLQSRTSRQRILHKRKLLLLAGAVLLPLTAYSLTLSDYLNSSSVTASSSQFETVTSNNSSTVQITPNAELIIVKNVINDNGGDAVLTDFGVNTDAGALNFGAGSVTGSTTTYTSDTVYIAPGTYSLTENDVDGYAEGAWSCTTGTLADSSFDNGSVVLSFGQQTVCTITNNDIAPKLTLVKTVTNDDGGDLAISDFSISIDSTVVASGTPTDVDANTTITISELDLDGYTEGMWSCTDANSLTTGLPSVGAATGTNLILESGSDVTCSITNDDIAPTLTLTKTLTNDDGGVLTIGDFDISIDTTEVLSGVSNTVVANTDIDISELALDGYTEGSWSCTDSNSLTTGLPSAGLATNTTVNLKPGSAVNCAITNDDIAPTLTLAKTLVNNNGGNAVVTDFDLSVDSTVVTSGVANTVAANIDIDISELDLAGYSEGTWSCVDANSLTTGLPTAGLATATTVNLASGSAVTCSITNDDVAPTLTLVKTLVNDNGGDLAITDFDIAIDGTEVTSGVSNLVAANTDIEISELDVDGYTEGTWSCIDSNSLTTGLPTAGLATGETIQLAEGAAVTCSITNDDIAPTLTLTKNLSNDNGGDKTIADFDLSIDSTGVSSGVANTVSANTIITISELDLDGYTEGTWSCTDSQSLTTGLPTAGLATGVDLTLEPGSVVSCVISNDDIAPTLTLTKTLLNDNGGDLIVDDFDVSIDGVEIVNGALNTVDANVDIVLSELALSGYTPGSWSCTDANALTTGLPTSGAATGTTISLLPGSAVSCAISNDDIAPKLTLTKSLINDNGGDKTIADFDLSIDGTEVVSGASNTVSANTAIVISELSLAGYTTGTWSCTDANALTTGLPSTGTATGETITLKQGSDVSCAISNDDIAPSLTLVKTVVNDNGGDKAIADFDISIDSTEVVSGVANTILANTDITISELDLQAYAEGTWACTDANSLTTGLPTAGLATGTTVNALPGSDITCSITNNDLGIDLSIAKTVDDNTPNIGQEITFTLTVNNAGPDVATNVTVGDVVPSGFTYVANSITGGDGTDDSDATGAGLSWSLTTVPVSTAVVLTFKATVNAP